MLLGMFVKLKRLNQIVIGIVRGKNRMLIRNHLLCPYSDCIANKRSGDLRIQVLVNQLSGKREVRLKTSVSGERGKTDLPYKHTNEVYHGFCPYCNRPVE